MNYAQEHREHSPTDELVGEGDDVTAHIMCACVQRCVQRLFTAISMKRPYSAHMHTPQHIFTEVENIRHIFSPIEEVGFRVCMCVAVTFACHINEKWCTHHVCRCVQCVQAFSLASPTFVDDDLRAP